MYVKRFEYEPDKRKHHRPCGLVQQGVGRRLSGVKPGTMAKEQALAGHRVANPRTAEDQAVEAAEGRNQNGGDHQRRADRPEDRRRHELGDAVLLGGGDFAQGQHGQVGHVREHVEAHHRQAAQQQGFGERARRVVDLFGHEGHRIPGVVGEEGIRERDGQSGQEADLPVPFRRRSAPARARNARPSGNAPGRPRSRPAARRP